MASFDSNPPFGFVDAKSKKIEGLDMDFAQALADKLKVKLEVIPTNPANRVPLLVSGKVDLVVANFTISEERAKQVDFSIPYFASGQHREVIIMRDEIIKIIAQILKKDVSVIEAGLDDVNT